LRNGDGSGRTSVARGLNRNQLIQVGRFSSSENFVREELVIYAFSKFLASIKIHVRGSMRKIGGFDNGTGKRVLNKLKMIKVRFTEIDIE